MALRYYRNGPSTTLVASVGSTDTAITVGSASGFPTTTPFTLILDEGQGVEEVVDVTGIAGATLTISRGADSTTAFPHSAGAVVSHGISARDAREANSHINAKSAVHGVVGTLVGTTDAQTLSAKTLTSSSFQGGSLSNTAISGGTITGTRLQDSTAVQPNSGNTTRPFSIRLVDGTEVGYIDRSGGLVASSLIAKGVAGGTADLLSAKTSAGVGLEVTEAGRAGLGTTAGSATALHVRAFATGDTALRILRIAGQTGNLISVVDENSAVLFRVSSDGTVTAPNISPGDWTDLGLASGYVTFEATPQYRMTYGGKKVELRGSVKRSAGGGIGDGSVIMTVPGWCRPLDTVRIPVAAAVDTSGVAANLKIVPAGQANLAATGLPTWVCIQGSYWVD